MSAVETIKAAYAALGRNDSSVLFGPMHPDIGHVVVLGRYRGLMKEGGAPLDS